MFRDQTFWRNLPAEIRRDLLRLKGYRLNAYKREIVAIYSAAVSGLDRPCHSIRRAALLARG